MPLYDQSISRQYPGLFVILLDQSLSMQDPVSGDPNGQTKADIVTRMVNTIIQEMIDRAGVEETDPGMRKKNAYLSVLGYDDAVRSLLSPNFTPVDIPTLANHPLGMIPEVREIRDNQNRIIRTLTERKNYWIKPYPGTNTNMKLAFEYARDVVDTWLRQAPEKMAPDLGYQRPRDECFPPVVINVTDGHFNTGGSPDGVVRSLCNMGTQNGNVLVFNCHFTTVPGKACIFPHEAGQVQGIDPKYQSAERMFNISSVIPDSLVARAERELRQEVKPGARGFIYNASFDILAQFLRWGTVPIIPATDTGATWR